MAQPTEQGLEMDNLVSFFTLLLKIDMRVNPELYKKQENHPD